MGRKTNKQRRQLQASTAREKAALARAEHHRETQRRRAMSVIATVVVIAVVGVIVAVIAINHKGKQSASGDRAPANPAVVKDLTSVSAATLQKVEFGTDKLAPKKVTTDPPLTSGGKPEVLFIGAEFCPYCGAERWPLIQALSRFGTFSNLNEISSSSTDIDPNTPTFSFYKSSYTSKYISFVPVENETRTSGALDNPTNAEATLWEKYTGNPPAFPFIDYGGKYVQTSQSYDPGLLKGLTQSQVASQLNNPNGKIAKAIDGEANVTTATICSITNNQPASVCLSPMITTIQSQLGG